MSRGPPGSTCASLPALISARDGPVAGLDDGAPGSAASGRTGGPGGADLGSPPPSSDSHDPRHNPHPCTRFLLGIAELGLVLDRVSVNNFYSLLIGVLYDIWNFKSDVTII